MLHNVNAQIVCILIERMNRLNNRKSMVFIALLTALVLLLSGCDLIRVNEEKDRKIVVARVNGEEILKGEVLDAYLMNYGEPEEYNKEIMADILDSLIEEKLLMQKSTAAGYVVNDDIRDRAKQEYEQALEDRANMLKEQADENADPNTDYQKRARDDMTEYFAAAGTTEEKYLDDSAEYIAIKDYLDELMKDLVVSDIEIEEYYQDELESQSEYPSMAAYYSAVPIVTEPAMRRVKHILIKLQDEDAQAVKALRQENKTEDADKLREEKLKAIEAEAERVLDETRTNKDFESLIIKHGEDPGMEMEENKDGYTMLRDASMLKEFLEASFEMEEGEISGLVATDAGYHIIKVYEASEDVTVSLEDVKEDIREVLLNNKKSGKIGEYISEWLEEAEIKKYEKRL